MGRTNKGWSYSAGERGRNRVRVYEDARSWSVLMEVYEDGSRIRTALGHKDRDRAKREADQAAARVRLGREASIRESSSWTAV